MAEFDSDSDLNDHNYNEEEEEEQFDGSDSQDDDESAEEDDAASQSSDSDSVSVPALFHERSTIRKSLPLPELDDYLPGKRVSRAQLQSNASKEAKSAGKTESKSKSNIVKQQNNNKKQKEIQEDDDQDEEDEDEEENEDEDEELDEDDEEEDDDDDGESGSVGMEFEFEDRSAPNYSAAAAAFESTIQLTGQSSATNDAQKARDLRHQRHILDQLLNGRIQVQPILQAANRFPDPKTLETLKEETADSDVIDWNSVKSIEKGLTQRLDDLLSLQRSLIVQTAHLTDEEKALFREDLEPKKKKTKTLEQYDQQLESQFQGLQPYFKRIIDRWNTKTQAQMGNLAVLGELKALNQTVWNQIENVLVDERALIRRTKLNRSAGTPAGNLVRLKRSRDEDGDEEEDNYDDHGPQALLDGRREVYDQHIFDDQDFYSQLLHEILTSASGSVDPVSISGGSLGKNRVLGKNGRIVDRRASKGRKLKYIVHPKLVQFCAPVERNSVEKAEFAVEELFRHLFGRNPEAK